MPNGTYGGVRGRKTKVGRKLLRFPPTRFLSGIGLVGLLLSPFSYNPIITPADNPLNCGPYSQCITLQGLYFTYAPSDFQ